MSKIIVRSFNDKGMMIFSSFIRETRCSENEYGELLAPPKKLLNDQECLNNTTFATEVDIDRKFQNRYEFAVYLINSFGKNFKDSWYDDHGLWAWLAFAYLDQLRIRTIRRRKGGDYATQHEAHFISDKWRKSTGQPKWYRHAIHTPFYLTKRYGEKAKFFINSKTMTAMGDIIEQMLSDPKILSSDKIVSLIFEKYSRDDGFAMKGTGAYSSPAKAKTGSKSGYGKLRRLTDDFLPRIKLTHDIDIMKNDEIIAVCGREFQ
jgi:hypothetical protein